MRIVSSEAPAFFLRGGRSGEAAHDRRNQKGVNQRACHCEGDRVGQGSERLAFHPL